MKGKNLLIGVILTVVVVGGIIVFNQNSSSTFTPPTSEIQDAKRGSRYVEYSKVTLDETADKRRVLYFYASWCPTCRPADANFKSDTNKIPDDVVVIRVNYNDPETDQEEKDLAKKYAITYQHTFVQIDAQGNEIAKWNGGDIPELLENLK